jgi:hypothetical protein
VLKDVDIVRMKISALELPTPRAVRKRDSGKRTMGVRSRCQRISAPAKKNYSARSSTPTRHQPRKIIALGPLPPILGQCSRDRLHFDNLLWRNLLMISGFIAGALPVDLCGQAAFGG